MACAGTVYTLVSVRAWPRAQKFSRIAFGPLGDCCVRTGTIELEEVAAFRPITPKRQNLLAPGFWLLTPVPLLITD